MSGIKVTIAIPVYNAEDFIEDCLNSILNQTMPQDDIEIILVNDGSKDKSKEILERYVANYQNIRVFHQENSGGPGKPRNVAIENAKGEYIFFVDADDYLGEEALERMYRMGKENNTDVILGKLVGVGGRGVAKSMFQYNQPRTDIFSSNIVYTLSPQKMIKKELLLQNSIRFPEGAATAEDQPFMLKVYILANGISVVADYPCYYLAHHENNDHASTMGVQPSKFYKIIGDAVEVIKNYVGNSQHKKKLLITYFTRHFDFSRTKSFMLANISMDTKLEWQKELIKFLDQNLDVQVESQLSPRIKVFLHLVRNAGIEELIKWRNSEKSITGRVEEDRIKLDESFLNSFNIPSDLADFTTENKIEYKLLSLNWNGDKLELTGFLYHSIVSTDNQQITAVWKNRKTSEEIRQEVKTLDMEQNSIDKYSIPFYGKRKSGFDFSYEVKELFTSKTFIGPWDLFFDVSIDGYQKRARIGSKRVDSISNHFQYSLIGSASVPIRPYYTANFDNLSIDVGEMVSSLVDVELHQASWDTDNHLLISGVVFLDLIPDITIENPRLKLVIKERDKERLYKQDIKFTYLAWGQLLFESEINLYNCANGKKIPAGVWDFSIEVLIGNYVKTIRFGYKRMEETKQVERTFSLENELLKVKGYFTKPYGNLSLIVSREPEKKTEEEVVVKRKTGFISKVKRKIKTILKKS